MAALEPCRIVPRLIVALALLSVSLPGCASGRRSVPLPAVGSDSATVVVIRPTRFTGGFVPWKLTLDGRVIASIGNGEHVVFGVAPGEHLLGMDHHCAGCDEITSTVIAQTGRIYYFRMSMTAGFGTVMHAVTRIDEPQGRALMEKTARLK